MGSVVMAVPADGSAGGPELMSPAEGHFHPHTWSHDGREIILSSMVAGPTRSVDLVRFSLQQKGQPQNLVATGANEGDTGAALSPDGEWLAYVSDETGRDEIWVRPFPHAGPPVRLSANGGVEPVWARNGRELYYLERNKMMSVPVSAGSQFNFKPATMLFESRYQHAGQPPTYDVAADGRFVMIKNTNPQLSSFNVLLNWNPAAAPTH